MICISLPSVCLRLHQVRRGAGPRRTAVIVPSTWRVSWGQSTWLGCCRTCAKTRVLRTGPVVVGGQHLAAMRARLACLHQPLPRQAFAGSRLVCQDCVGSSLHNLPTTIANGGSGVPAPLRCWQCFQRRRGCNQQLPSARVGSKACNARVGCGVPGARVGSRACNASAVSCGRLPGARVGSRAGNAVRCGLPGARAGSRACNAGTDSHGLSGASVGRRAGARSSGTRRRSSGSSARRRAVSCFTLATLWRRRWPNFWSRVNWLGTNLAFSKCFCHTLSSLSCISFLSFSTIFAVSSRGRGSTATAFALRSGASLTLTSSSCAWFGLFFFLRFLCCFLRFLIFHWFPWSIFVTFLGVIVSFHGVKVASRSCEQRSQLGVRSCSTQSLFVTE